MVEKNGLEVRNKPFSIGMDGDGIDWAEMTFHSGEFFFEDQMEKSSFKFACLC